MRRESYLLVSVDYFRGVLYFQDKDQLAIARSKCNCGRGRETLHANKGASPSPYNKMGVYAVYIISKAGGLIYSLDNQRAPSEVQLLCKYPPSFVLEEGDRGVMVKFGEEGGVKGKQVISVAMCMCTMYMLV